MPDLSGRTLGKYRLVERLGRGGMAEVYRAFQPSLEREVAIKVMHGYLADDETFIGRFKREAKAVASLRHPNIVQVYDFDIEEDMYYMVMEYIDGETLKARLKRLNGEGRRMSLPDVARIYRALGNALDYAHAQGRIHRDLKPGNVMFDGDRPVLTDFGLATIVGGTRYTIEGSVIGTPAYMSPEQAQGKAGNVLSDVYALGVMLYETVTGRVPFDADTPLAIIMMHVNEPLPMPGQIVAELPLAVERVILKALAKSPQDRYQSAGALADALEGAVKEAVEVAPVAVPSPPEEPPAMVPAAPSAEVAVPTETPSAAALPADVTPPVDIVLPADTTDTPPSDAALPLPLPKPKPKRRRWVFLGAALLIVLALVVASFVILPEILGDNEPIAGPGPGESPVRPSRPIEQPLPPDSEATAHFERGTASFRAGDLEEAIAEFTRAIEIAPRFAPAYHLRGVAYREIDQLDKAEADLNEAIKWDPSNAEAYYDRGYLYFHGFDRWEDALVDLTQAIELNPDHVEAYLLRAQILLWYAGEEDRATADLNRALQIDPRHPVGHCIRGEIFLQHQEYDRAIEDLTISLELNWEDFHCHWLLGQAFFWQEDYDAAVVHYSEAIELAPHELDLYYHRAFAFVGTDDLGAALEDWERVLRVDPDHAGAHYGRGLVLAEFGDYEGAIHEFTIVTEHERFEYEWPYFIEDSPYIDRAWMYYYTDRIEEAMTDLGTLIDQDPYWYVPYYYRGMLHEEIGDIEAARADYERLWELAPDEEWRRTAEELLENL